MSDDFASPERKQHHPKASSLWTTPRGQMVVDLDALEWQDGAACKGMDQSIFFLERGASTKAVKKICAGCEIREACLDWAIENNEKYGIWGGMSDRQRRVERRRRAAEQAKKEAAREKELAYYREYQQKRRDAKRAKGG